MGELTLLQTGQYSCYNSKGLEIDCSGSGQDGEYLIGTALPEFRFLEQEQVVHDLATDLVWTKNANPNDFPLSWQDALDLIKQYNVENFLGYNDWRLPNRRELRSIMGYQSRKPSLPKGHPFNNVFLNWYWSSTTAAIDPAYAWYVHLEGARMFYGRKDQFYLVWPVRGNPASVLARTGQQLCFDCLGNTINCTDSGQDAGLAIGIEWPESRFEKNSEIVHDTLTGLDWPVCADASRGEPVNWREALELIQDFNKKSYMGVNTWRLPNINELESLVDCSQHTPALPIHHPFNDYQEGYWSSTTSFFETDWAWVLYMHKGACGVGHKPGKEFFVWPVSGP